MEKGDRVMDAVRHGVGAFRARFPQDRRPRRSVTRVLAAIATASLVVSTLVATTSVSASAAPAPAVPCASAVAGGPASVGRIHGIARPSTTRPACASVAALLGGTASSQSGGTVATGANPPLLNHGGPVMGTSSTGDQVVVTPIFWAPPGYSFSAAYKSLITQYLTDAAADSGKTTNVFASMFQYSGSNGAINYRMSVGTPINDATAPFGSTTACPIDAGAIYSDSASYTSCITDVQVTHEIDARLTAASLPRDLGHLYVLFLPKQVETCYDASTTSTPSWQCSINAGTSSAFCGYHSAFDASGHVLYANMPYPIYTSATGSSCTDQNLGGGVQAPNGASNRDADVEISPLSHEVAEAITDPDGNAWYDLAGYENGDDCAYVYGTLSGSLGAQYNQTINGHRYLTQEEFSNEAWNAPATEPCVQRIPDVTPVITGITPATGPTAGGQAVTITGTGFPGATAVKFGTTPATFTITDATHITASAPAGAAGLVDVTVTAVLGTSSTVVADHYTYVPPAPAVTAIAPSSGPVAGGGQVTITGTTLTGATAVHFGATAATFTVDSATQITATAPSSALGSVHVTVTTPSGTSTATSADSYTYTDLPTVASVTPSSGPAAGGTSVTITGSGLGSLATTTVTFGGVPGSVVAADSVHVDAVAPAHASGTVDVVVTVNGNSSPVSSADHFTYVAAPVVTGVSPDAGPSAGGSTVTITGSNLTGATVTFDGTPAPLVTVVDDGHVTATSPAHAAGIVDVVVSTPSGGSSAVSAADSFTYADPPTATSVSPAAGPLAGGSTVTVTGSGLATTTAVSFGGVDGFFTVLDGAHLSVTVPSHAAGAVDVVVTTAGGSTTPSPSTVYTYVAAPTVTRITPVYAPLGGGSIITITGTNFRAGATVSVGGVASTSVVVASPTRITARVRAHAAGTVDVRVSTVGGSSAISALDRLRYLPRPVVTAVSPGSGKARGGARITVSGSGFVPGSVVRIGSVLARVISVTATRIVVVAPRHAAGLVAVTVVTPGGTSAARLAARYRYV